MKLSYLNLDDLGPQDEEWAEDWNRINKVYRDIEDLEQLFNEFNVSYLRDLHQKMLIINLKKYAWSLQSLILEKYSDIRPNDEDLA